MSNNTLKNTPFVSVIVPVYNTKEYLEQCFNSLRYQTLKDIEIIAIDDGSTDGSGTVCEAFASEDARFRIIHKKNEGLSAARNDGLNIALADYILFVDSDDWVEPNLCEETYLTAIENNADIVVFQYYRYWKEQVTMKDPFPKEGVVDKEIVLTTFWEYTSVVAWNKLYRKTLFNEIRYPIGRLCEDTAVAHLLVYNAETIYIINKYLYHHRVYRPGSIMNSKSATLISDGFLFEFKRLNDMKRWGYDCKKEELNFAFDYLIKMGIHAELAERCNRILRERKNYNGNFSWKKKLLFQVYMVSPFFFECIMNLFRKPRKR